MTTQEIARTLDHAVLRPDATLGELEAACRMAAREGIATVCVRPSDLPVARTLLAGSATLPGTVIGFPHGTTSAAAKVAEARQAVLDGAAELDMVLNIGRLKSGDLVHVEDDIAAVLAEARRLGVLLKVIFENTLLSDAEKLAACAICSRLRVDFVKTSTGFAGGGATLEDLVLMRTHSDPSVSVKASGGIRDLDSVLAALAVGADRIGTSSTEAILAESRKREAAGTLAPMAREDALARTAQGKGKTY